MDLDPEAKRVLSLAQAARTPSDEDKARVEKRLALALGVAAAAAPTVVAAKAVAGSSTLKGATGVFALKWWLGGSVMLAAAVGGVVALSPAPEPRPMVAKQRVTRVHQAPAQPVVEAPPAPALAQPAAPQPEVAPEEPAAARARVEPRRPRERSDALSLELTLLHRAQAAWRAGQAKQALGLVREHGQRFPRSTLDVERDAIEVLALCELGQRERATRLARKLLSRAPGTPMRAAIEESCALR